MISAASSFLLISHLCANGLCWQITWHLTEAVSCHVSGGKICLDDTSCFSPGHSLQLSTVESDTLKDSSSVHYIVLIWLLSDSTSKQWKATGNVVCILMSKALLHRMMFLSFRNSYFCHPNPYLRCFRKSFIVKLSLSLDCFIINLGTKLPSFCLLGGVVIIISTVG